MLPQEALEDPRLGFPCHDSTTVRTAHRAFEGPLYRGIPLAKRSSRREAVRQIDLVLMGDH